jgi:catechol 2,3-dioxygenase-like lactoylglutathione lyase family enzyme
MAINPKISGIHHINLRCSDLLVSKNFYQNVLGFPVFLETEELFAFPVSNVFIVFKKAEQNAHFNPFTIGTDHIAMACESEEELSRIARELSEQKVENTGVKTDPTLQKLYVAFKDPDRIQWEFFMV